MKEEKKDKTINLNTDKIFLLKKLIKEERQLTDDKLVLRKFKLRKQEDILEMLLNHNISEVIDKRKENIKKLKSKVIKT